MSRARVEKRKRENVEESVLGETAAVRSRSAPSARGGSDTDPHRATLVAAHDHVHAGMLFLARCFLLRGGEQPDARAVDMRRWWWRGGKLHSKTGPFVPVVTVLKVLCQSVVCRTGASFGRK